MHAYKLTVMSWVFMSGFNLLPRVEKDSFECFTKGRFVESNSLDARSWGTTHKLLC